MKLVVEPANAAADATDVDVGECDPASSLLNAVCPEPTYP
jgi:hypothetical protein